MMDLGRALAEIEDPLTHSSEGLDDGCFFCGAWDRFDPISQRYSALHEQSCLWVIARQRFSVPIAPHGVKNLWDVKELKFWHEMGL